MSTYAGKPWLKHYDFWVPAEINPPRQSLYQILMLASTQFHDRPAIAFEGTQITYYELRRHVERLAAALYELGIRKGDRVAIMLPNCPQYTISFFALVRLGAVAVNINPSYTPREIAAAAADSGARIAITLDTLAAGFSGIEHIVTTSLAAWSANPSPGGSFEELLASAGSPAPAVKIDPEEDLAVLQYTGGTTGAPKAAMLTHFSLYSNTIQTAVWTMYLTRRGEERVLLVIPQCHIYGHVVGMLLAAWHGSLTILIPKFEINAVIAAFRDHSPTHFPGVPTLYISLLNHPEAATCGLDRVRVFGCGSAPLPLEVIEKFEQLSGGLLREGYGLTEASPTTHSTPVLGKRKPGSVGLPFPSTEAKIVGAIDGERVLPAGEDGELCVRGPQVMKGYWQRPEENAATLRDGWLYTGDIARMDADGYFYIVQRKKDMVIVGGFKVYPTEVEEVLFTHPAVLEAAVIGVPDSYRGEAVKAFIVLKQGRGATTGEITEYCRARLAKFKTPSRIEFVESLPKSPVGKILRRMLRQSES